MNNQKKSTRYNPSNNHDYVSMIQELLGIQTIKNRRAIEKLDLLLLAIEAVDINASVSISSLTNTIELEHIFPNYVEVWKSRCHNPMRRSSRNSPISRESFDALLLLLSKLSQRFYPQIRNLLSSSSSNLDNQYIWSQFCYRFEELISERLNSRRVAVKNYLIHSRDPQIFYKKILFILALSSGDGGEIRLRSSLFEPLSLLK